MKQITLSQAANQFDISARPTRKRIFLDEMQRVVPWDRLVALISVHAPSVSSKGGRPAFALDAMLRIHLMQQWFGHGDQAMEEALHDVPLYREFCGLDAGATRLPDESTILRFRHLLERHGLADKLLETVNAFLSERGLILKHGTAVDATLIAAPSSTKNKDGTRDPEMHQTKKGNQWHFGMKAHIGVDTKSGLVHSVVGTAANVHDLNVAPQLLHGQEIAVFADAGYQGADKRQELRGPLWQVAMRPGKRKAQKHTPWGAISERLEQVKARVRAKVEHPFRVIKCQFGYVKVRYRGLAKNTAQLKTLFALSNLWMVRRQLMASAG
jgi:IS5 family transposase